MPNRQRQDWSDLLDGDSAAADALWTLTADYGAAVAEDVNVDAAWERLRTRATVSRPRARRRPLRYLLPAAAAAAVALLFLVNYFAAGDTRAARFANATSAPRAVELPDESTVMLAPGSEIAFSGGASAREAHLHGAARFDVTGDPGRPFVVAAEGFRLVVVGTQFTVTTGDPASVVVHEGHVRLRGALEADWVDLYGGDSAKVVGHLVEFDTSSPPDRPLAFSAAPLSEVATALAEAGVMQLDVPSALAHCEVVGDFTDQPAAQVAETLAVTFGARVRRRGDRYALRGGSCATAQ